MRHLEPRPRGALGPFPGGVCMGLGRGAVLTPIMNQETWEHRGGLLDCVLQVRWLLVMRTPAALGENPVVC